MFPFHRELAALYALHSAHDELEVDAGVDDIACGQHALLEGRGCQVNGGPPVLVKRHGGGDVRSLILNGWMDDDGVAREVFFLGVAQGEANTVTCGGDLNIVVHDLKRFGVPRSVGRQQQHLVVHVDTARLDIADSDQADPFDVEVLVNRQDQRRIGVGFQDALDAVHQGVHALSKVNAIVGLKGP